jgi:predicted RNA-binding Zn-ribbon protein involved in translation (DUF1610 family)
VAARFAATYGPAKVVRATEEENMTRDITLEASCPDCGRVELRTHQAWLVLSNSPVEDTLDFRCPSCAGHVRCPADHQTVTALAALVPVEEVHVPAEALERHTGRPLTLDDLIDLMLSLDPPQHHPQSPTRAPHGDAALRPVA